MKQKGTIPMFNLRDYQSHLINKTREAMRKGYRKPLVVLPCGGGKTVMFAYMAREHVKMGGYVHFYVHRRELIDQTIQTFKAFNIPMEGVYIGMVQKRSFHKTKPTLIIFDEAHHATAKLWTNITDKISRRFYNWIDRNSKKNKRRKFSTCV